MARLRVQQNVNSNFRAAMSIGAGRHGEYVKIQKILNSESELPLEPVQANHAYIINQDLYVWEQDKWVNVYCIKGEKGEAGAIGATGKDGVAGAKGDKGEQGERGLQGEKGDRGEIGPKGADGTMTFEDLTPEQLASLKGDKGDKGEKGDTGLTGEAGADGKAFEYSDFTPEQLEALKGDKGEVGATGPKGDRGEQGIAGERGLTGTNGIDGVKGDAFKYSDFTQEQLLALKGDQGERGIAGINGLDGQDGKSAYEVAVINGYAGTEEDWLLSLKGERGLTGAKGDTGEAGPAGPAGRDGVKGDKGEPGVDGKDGSDATVDLTPYSTTEEMNVAISTAIDAIQVPEIDTSLLATKEELETGLESKADALTTYNKTEVDDLIAENSGGSGGGFINDLGVLGEVIGEKEQIEILASMPNPRYSLSTVVANNNIYVLLSLNNNKYMFGVFMYNTSTDTWKALPSMPTDIYSFSYGAYENNIYVFGGMLNGVAVDTVYMFDTTTETWHEKAKMPVAMYSAVSNKIYKDKFYIIGGHKKSGSNTVSLADSMAYDFKNNTWEVKASMLKARYSAGTCYVDNKVFFFGGSYYSGSSTYQTKNIDCYDYDTNTWTALGELDKISSGLSTVYADNKIAFVKDSILHLFDINLNSFKRFNLPNSSTVRKVLAYRSKFLVFTPDFIQEFDVKTNKLSQINFELMDIPLSMSLKSSNVYIVRSAAGAERIDILNLNNYEVNSIKTNLLKSLRTISTRFIGNNLYFLGGYKASYSDVVDTVFKLKASSLTCDDTDITRFQIARGNTSQVNAYKGKAGELAINTDTYELMVYDGKNSGGIPLISKYIESLQERLTIIEKENLEFKTFITKMMESQTLI